MLKWWNGERDPKWWNGYIVISCDIISLGRTCNTTQIFPSLNTWKILGDLILNIFMILRISLKVLLNKYFNCANRIRNNITPWIESRRPWIMSIICLNSWVLEKDNRNPTLQVLTPTNEEKNVDLTSEDKINIMSVLNLPFQEVNN